MDHHLTVLRLVNEETFDELELLGGIPFTTTRFSWTKPVRSQRRQRPRGHGSVDLTRYYDGRLFEVAGLVYADDEDDAQEALNELEGFLALNGDTVLLRWQFNGNNLGFLYEQSRVRIDGDIEYAYDVEDRSRIKWALTLFAEDPRRYNSIEVGGSYDPTATGAFNGIDLPAVFPLEFAGDGANILEVTNDGNFPTPPVFRIWGPVTNPILDNDTTGESLTTSGLALTSSDMAEVDMAARTFKVNGVDRPDFIDASATTWFELIPGDNALRLRGSDMVGIGSGGTTLLEVIYHDARI